MKTLVPDSVYVLAAIWSGLLGAAAGSFLNVVIARVPHGQSIVRPRSRCPACGTPIAARDNIPILSWLLLRGRCRACRAAISWRYPLVELLGAGAGVAAFLRHGLTAAAAIELAGVALLLALSFIDLDTWLLPHRLTLPLAALGLVAAALGLGPAPSLLSSALGAAVGFGAFALVGLIGSRLLRKEALGFGDVVLLGALGAWLGLRALLPVVLLASLQGAAVGLLLVGMGRLRGGEPSPSDGGEPVEPPPSVGGVPAPDPSTGPASLPEASSLDAEAAWIPPAHAIPFGPFLALGALEWLYLAGPLSSLVPMLDLFR